MNVWAGGAVAELEKLRRQAQELVDENQALKLTVDRLKERLCRHRSRTPTHEEERRTTELEKELQETQRLHDDAARPGGHSQQECSQLQQLAALVLQENQALVHQLEAHHSRSKAAHENHQCEVSKVSKQLMLAEVENERLQEALQESSRQVKTCQREVQVLKARLEEAVTWEEHCRITGRLNRQREQLESRTQSQLDDLLLRVSSEQKQSGSLARDKAQLAAQVGRLESELERSILSSRTDEARMSVLKRQRRRSQLKEEKSRLYLQAAVAAAEHVSLERDRLLLMASDLQQQRDQFIIRIQSGAVQFGRLEQEVKEYRRQVTSRLAALKEAAEGTAARYQGEMLHLQRLLKERQQAEERLLQCNRRLQEELEAVWLAALREPQLGVSPGQSPEPQRRSDALDKCGLDLYC
ncbi:centrosomal protein of 89 kDa [Synchiropus picturatus]